MSRYISPLVVCLVIGLHISSAVRADTVYEPGAATERTGQFSFEFFTGTEGNFAPVNIKIYLTDKDHKIMDDPTGTYPKTVEAHSSITPVPGTGYYSASVYIPPQLQTSLVPVKVDPVKDFKFFFTTLASAPFQQVSMEVESIQHNAVDGYFIASVFDQIADVVGENVDVNVPFINSTGDGDLYSLVDMNVYLFASPPTVSLFDTLTITDGESGALPGMLFSSTPFELDALDGLQYTPFNGDVVVTGNNILTALPEPSTIVLAACGFLGVAAFCRLRKR